MAGQDLPAKIFTALKVAAGLRTGFVDRAEERDRIKGDARSVAPLIHAAHAGVLGDVLLRHVIARPQLDHEMAAAAATGARGKVGMEIDASTRTGRRALGDDGVG